MAKQSTSEIKCKPWGWVFLVVGIMFLLADLGYWDFWGIKWWTAAFLLLGMLKIWGHH